MPRAGLGAIRLTGGLPGFFTGMFGAHLRAHDLAAPDDFARLGAHGRSLKRALRALDNAART
jgi:hypothetical protein